MAKKKDTETETDYISASSVDNPPKEEKEESDNEGKQFLYRGERKFAVSLILKLKPIGGQPVTIPVIVDTIRGTMVDEMIRLAFEDPRNSKVIASVLDNPRGNLVLSEIPVDDEKDAQGNLFGDNF